MKYKYRLIERNEPQEPASPSDKFREANTLILSAKGKYTLKDILNILSNPKPEYLKGVYVPFSESEKDVKLNIYGEKNIMANIDKNEQLKLAQKEKYGKLFYKYVEDILSTKKGKPVKFERIVDTPIGGTNKFILNLPLMTKNNNDIIADYIKLTKSDKKTSGIKWEELSDEAAVKILTDNMSISEKTIKTILTNAGLKLGEDYSLRKEKVISENTNLLKKIINETLNEKFGFKKGI